MLLAKYPWQLAMTRDSEARFGSAIQHHND